MNTSQESGLSSLEPADTVPTKDLLSLFSGAGGLDCGFEAAGFKVAAAFDLRSDAIASYNHNRPLGDRNGHVGNVADLTVQKLDEIVGRRFEPRGVIGGPPCQSFSRATHSAEDDPRHDLPLKFASLVSALNARSPVDFFVMENVPGLLKSKHADRLAEFKKQFVKAGFTVTQMVLNASSFGVPQNRPRLIMVGLNSQKFPDASWSGALATHDVPLTVEDALKGLPEPAYWTRSLGTSDIPHHPNHWCMTPKSISFSTKGRLVPGTARGRSFRTLAWGAPSHTVAYGHREVHVHPDCHRRLSVFEAMLLQGFPPSYQLLGSLSSQITQVSEAVPPPLGEAVARSVLELIRAQQPCQETGEQSERHSHLLRSQVVQAQPEDSRPQLAAI